MAPINLSVNVAVLRTLVDDGKSQIIWIAARVARAVADSKCKIDTESHRLVSKYLYSVNFAYLTCTKLALEPLSCAEEQRQQPN